MKTVLVAHRGAQLVAPENTLTAFRRAIASGYKAVECDVQSSSDGKLFVIHDEDVDRMTDGKGWVSRLSAAKIQSLRIGIDERIPTMMEVIELVAARSKTRLIIEIKADTARHALDTAKSLAVLIRSLPRQTRKYIEVCSFWYVALGHFKTLCPNIRIAAIIAGGFGAEDIIAIARRVNAEGVSLNFEFISKSIVRQCNDAGLFVDTWAISDGTVLKRVRPFGLRAIVENFTGKVLR